MKCMNQQWVDCMTFGVSSKETLKRCFFEWFLESNCNLWLRFALHTSFRQKCLKLRCLFWCSESWHYMEVLPTLVVMWLLGQSGRRVELLLMAGWPNGKIAWEQNCLRLSCSWESLHFGLNSGSWVHPYWAPCNLWLRFALHTSFRQKCLKLRCHDFSALADWSPKQIMSCTLHAW